MKHFLIQGAVALVVGLAAFYVVETWLDEPLRQFNCAYLVTC